jgi:hypothetical protein
MTDKHDSDYVNNGKGNEHSLRDVLDVVERTRALAVTLGVVVFVLLLVVSGLVWQITQRNRAFRDVKDDITVIKGVAEDVRDARNENEGPDSTAIVIGLQRIDEILQILCDERPDHAECEGG